MSKVLERLRKGQEGLTLIELIVVVAIIGVLVWLITPRVLEALNNAKLQSALAVANEVQSAMERFAAEHDSSYLEPDIDPTWGDLTGPTGLGPYVTLPENQTSNLDTVTNFAHEADNAPATGPPTFCVALNAGDRDATLINITHAGILANPATPEC